MNKVEILCMNCDVAEEGYNRLYKVADFGDQIIRDCLTLVAEGEEVCAEDYGLTIGEVYERMKEYIKLSNEYFEWHKVSGLKEGENE